ncbi:MAG: sigma-54 dependent transcriptional regulator [Gammaproteobacteria bacterium]|nr:sigma-54 dependent transcriptional regulator [Gammaproteobacteria bacterium]
MLPYALIVDDEADIRELLEITLGRMDLQTQAAANVNEAKDLLAKQPFDLCLTDMRLPDGNGIEIVTHIQQHYPRTPVAMITAYGSMDTAIKALKAGAFDFVSKPIELGSLRDLVSSALQLNTDTVSSAKSRGEVAAGKTLLGESPIMVRLKATIVKVARSQAPVFLHGESGVGKELVARSIHAQGPRTDRPFVPVNCGAIPTDLMESEFFGHVKGSFTGAVTDKEGLFQAAGGGSLFLDEVADLPLHMQVKLLRAIQERAVKPVGAHRESHVDVRILSATHKDLLAEIDRGTFRQDLYYRINVIELKVPPLRDRLTDLSLLAGHFLDRIAAHWGEGYLALATDGLEKLLHYTFPGNVRELENILERAATLCDGNVIHADDLHLARAPAPIDTPPPAPEEAPALDGQLRDYLSTREKDAIVKALEQTRWNKTQAAKLLGLTFRQLRYRLKKLNIE